MRRAVSAKLTTGLDHAWQVWTGTRARSIVLALTASAAAALVLSAAGTLDAGFTLTVSYLLLAMAVVVGAPIVVRGWLTVPPACLVAAVVLVAIYALGVAFGSDAQVPGGSSRAEHRDLVYLADLVLGLSTLGLVVGVAANPADLRRLAVWTSLGGLVAAGYAVFQWPAQEFGWAFADLNNALNSDGYTLGHRFQGEGLFGWERVRGTFKEPLFLASYLTLVLCLTLGLAVGASRTGVRVAFSAITVLSGLALALTVSLLTWGVLVLVAVGVALVVALAAGRTRLAGVLGGLLAVMVLVAPALFADPSTLAPVTGRPSAALDKSSSNRTDAWGEAFGIWERRPGFGHGPGQSAVRLAYRPDDGPSSDSPVVLGSAQGLWAASLIDLGLLGLAAWIVLIGTLFTFSVRRIVTRPSALGLACLAAAASAVLLGNLSADRLDLRVWLALGLLCAAACQRGGTQSRQRDH